MRIAPWIIVASLIGFLPAVHARDVVITHSEPLQSIELGRIDNRGIADREQDAHSTLTFDALGQRFELELEPNQRLLRHIGASELPANVSIYRGRLTGKPNSWARIVITNGVPTGMIWDGQEMLALEASSDRTAAEIYRLRDTWVQPGTMSCGTGGEATTLATAYATITDEISPIVARAEGAVDEIRIGLVADFEFTQSMGDSVEADMLTRINNVDGIFSEQLDLQITVDHVDVFDQADDPFTLSEAGELLDELVEYRRVTPEQNSLGLTYMFTGRTLDGSTVGIAYLGTVCRSSVAASLGEGRRGVTTDSLIAAHEIGHNFGAEHDGEADSPCEATTGDWIMSPKVSNVDQFSSCSINTMRPFIDGASCVNPLPETDVSISLSGSVPQVLVGGTSDLVFEVFNAGTQDALNVSVDFTIPPNLAVDSVATAGGSCSSGAGTATCTVGTVSAGAGADVALSVTGAIVDTDTLVASVSADGDANLGDNSTSLNITVDPATDLRIASVSNRSATLNTSLSLAPRVENVSDYEATDVELTIEFGTGVTVDSATWSGGSCSITGGSIACPIGRIAARSNVTLDVRATPTTTGSKTVTASVSSAEADVESSDNSATATLSVTEPRSDDSSSDGGGGGVGLLFLALLGLARSRRSAL